MFNPPLVGAFLLSAAEREPPGSAMQEPVRELAAAGSMASSGDTELFCVKMRIFSKAQFTAFRYTVLHGVMLSFFLLSSVVQGPVLRTQTIRQVNGAGAALGVVHAAELPAGARGRPGAV